MRVLFAAILLWCTASVADAQGQTPTGVAMFNDFCLPFAMTEFEREEILPAVEALGFTIPSLTSPEEGSVRLNAYRLDWRVFTTSFAQDCYAFFPAGEAPAVRRAIELLIAGAPAGGWSQKVISNGIEWASSDPEYYAFIRLISGNEPHVR